MTDVVLETKQGIKIHYFINDNCPAIIHVREGDRLKVKMPSGGLDLQVKNALKSLEKG